MSRIVLRNLVYLTEQAPQAPTSLPDLGAGSPVPAPATPQGMNAGKPEDTQTPAATPETSPEPENPNEYDFTRDFRAFEDKKNKAEAEAKKVLLDKMNERLLNKTIIANASRGYGQPKTDYTIENVKKISVEFWYKDYVVIATDSNDKKYFLTPGINIKIESEGSEPAPGGQEQQAAPQQEVPPQGQPAPGGEEAPNSPPPTGQTPGQPPAGDDAQPAVGGEKPAPEQAPQPAPEAPPTAPPAAPPAPEQPAPAPQQLPPKKKKKKAPAPVAEWLQKDLNAFLTEFMSENVKDENGRVNYLPYVKKAVEVITENVNTTKVKCHLEIPQNHMNGHVQNSDIKLAAVDSMRKQTYYGQYSKGSVDITKSGRFYLLEYVKEVGWNI